jgi:hypothetical protein
MCFEAVNLCGLGFDGPLLLVRLWWAGECQGATDLFEETDGGRRATQIRLVDLIGGRHQRHSGRDIKRGDG